MSKQINIGGRLHSTEQGNVITGANEVLDDTKGKKQNVINADVDAELLRLDQSKQNNLTFDNTPTDNSNNPVKSSGVYAADKALSDAIDAILILIPSAATALNQLADKNFVNSSIATDTATFRGTSETGLSEAQFLEWANGLTHDMNDYVFWQTIDEAGNTLFKRYKWNGTQWLYEYTLNNSSFTADQWAAITSGITTALVEKLVGLPTNTALQQALNSKQDALTFDNVPTEGSNNPVKSGGVYSVVKAEEDARLNLAQTVSEIGGDVSQIEDVIPAGATAQNQLVANASMEAYVASIINNITASFTLSTADGHINLTLTQVNGQVATLTLTSSDIASAQALTALTGRVTTAEGNITSLTGRVSTNETDIANLQQLYNGLQQSKPVPVTALPETGQQQGVIYRLAGTTSYSDNMWNGSTWVLMATYNNAIDDEPTAGSDNLVKSGGVADVYGSYIDNPEYIEAKTDSDDKLLEARKLDGTKVEFCDLEVKGEIINNDKSLVESEFASSQSVIDNQEWLKVTTDSDEKIIEGIDKYGNKVVNAPIVLSEEALIKLAQDLGVSNQVVQISVKKDGTGDFTNIQDAINSINDASEVKRYEILVYDDFVSESFTDLRPFSNLSAHIGSVADITDSVGYVYLKDWVNITGVGCKRKIWFINPDLTTAGSKFQYIHNMYVCGNCKISNLDIRIKGGRYAIHQDHSGDVNPLTNPDVNAVTEYKNCHIEHFGNSDYTNGSSWNSEAALAACCSSGQTIKVENCHIESPYSSPLINHLNESYSKEANYIIIGTQIVCNDPSVNPDEVGLYFNDSGSCQKNSLTIIGSDLKISTLSSGSRTGKEQYTRKEFKRDGWDVRGYSNIKTYCQIVCPPVLYVVAKNTNEDVKITGGSAKDILFGDIKYYLADTQTKGAALGGLEVWMSKSQRGGDYSWSLTLPFILGNCASSPKNLIIEVGGVEHEVTFDQNYMTSDGSSYNYHTTPAISGETILNGINTSFSSYFSIWFGEQSIYSSHSFYPSMYSFSDCMEKGINYSSVALLPLQCVKRDITHGYNCWRLATAEETPDGIVGERIDGLHDGKYHCGNIILVDKVVFGFSDTMPRYWLGTSMQKGDNLVVGNNGYLVVDNNSESLFKALSQSSFIYSK